MHTSKILTFNDETILLCHLESQAWQVDVTSVFVFNQRIPSMDASSNKEPLKGKCETI